MIEVTKKTTKLEGTKMDLMFEFCCLVHNLITAPEEGKEPVLTRDELDMCIELATVPDDELHRRAMDAMLDIFVKILT